MVLILKRISTFSCKSFSLSETSLVDVSAGVQQTVDGLLVTAT